MNDSEPQTDEIPRKQPRFQFSLATLMVVVTGAAMILALENCVEGAGFLFSAFVVIPSVGAMVGRQFGARDRVEIIFCSGLGTGFVWAILGAVGMVQAAYYYDPQPAGFPFGALVDALFLFGFNGLCVGVFLAIAFFLAVDSYRFCRRWYAQRRSSRV